MTDGHCTCQDLLSFDQLQLSNKLNIKLLIVFIVLLSLSIVKKQETLRVVMIAMTCSTLASL